MKFLRVFLMMLIISSFLIFWALTDIILDKESHGLLVLLLLFYSAIVFNNYYKYRNSKYSRDSSVLGITNYPLINNIEKKTNLAVNSKYCLKVFSSDKVEAEIDSMGNVFISKPLFEKDIEIVESVIAHEIAHDVLKHTSINKKINSLFFVLYNMFFLIILQYSLILIVNLYTFSITGAIISVTLIVLASLYTLSFLIALKGFRELEFEADKQASSWGYGSSLIELFEDGSLTENKTATVFSTHPRLGERVKRLKFS